MMRLYDDEEKDCSLYCTLVTTWNSYHSHALQR